MKILKRTNKMLAKEGYNSITNLVKGDMQSYDLIEKGINGTEEEAENVINTYKSAIPFHDRFEKEREEELKKEQERKEEEEWRRQWNEKSLKERFKEKFKLNNNQNEDVLFKKNKDITAQEIKNATKYSWFESKDKELNKRINDKVSAWHSEVYGGDAKSDAMGRLISPEPKIKVASEPKKPLTKDGLDFEQGFQKVAEVMAEKKQDGLALQKRLNRFDYQPALKEDNDVGPKTTSRLKQAMYDYGVSELLKS